MATLWIREFRYIGKAPISSGQSAGMPVAQEPGEVNPTPVSFTTATQSAAFSDRTQYVTIIGSAAFHYLVGANPTATTDHLRIPANTLWSFGVQAGHKLSVVAAA